MHLAGACRRIPMQSLRERLRMLSTCLPTMTLWTLPSPETGSPSQASTRQLPCASVLASAGTQSVKCRAQDDAELVHKDDFGNAWLSKGTAGLACRNFRVLAWGHIVHWLCHCPKAGFWLSGNFHLCSPKTGLPVHVSTQLLGWLDQQL